MQEQSQVTCPQHSLRPIIDYGAYYSDIRSALTDAITNVVQKNADIDTEIKNAQDTVEFNIAE